MDEVGDDIAAEVERIRARIAHLIEDHFAQGATSYYLSQLGNELNEDRKSLERLTRKKISEFVQDEFSYEIGRTGSHKNVLFIVAPGADPAMPDAALPRYNRRFWAAFSVPLPEGERRFLDLNDLNFGPDLGDGRLDGNNIREIGSEFLPAANESRTPAQIGEQIKAWIDAQKLDEERFIVVRRKRSSDTGRNLLADLIAALDKDQLRRVSLPLDVVEVLRSKSR